MIYDIIARYIFIHIYIYIHSHVSFSMHWSTQPLEAVEAMGTRDNARFRRQGMNLGEGLTATG